MKTFDWTQFSERHRPAWAAWLEANRDKPVTEVEFTTAYRAQRADDERTHKARRYATAKVRQTYNN